ncbi:ATP-binding cassette domain-containing protein, partial [Mycolicibacterium insubricum]|nr:ATP-binding cassette domain-containing protein [Mycolicibacterium insubricum]
MSPSDPAGPALEFDDVSVVRGGRLIWSEGSFTVPTGGITAVIGPNGSGKTTLLQVVLGLLPAASGKVRVLGRAPGQSAAEIGYVPQHYAEGVGDAIRACDAVLLGLVGHRWGFGRASADQRARVDAVLAGVGAEEFAGRRLSELSGGQRQRRDRRGAGVAAPLADPAPDRGLRVELAGWARRRLARRAPRGVGLR